MRLAASACGDVSGVYVSADGGASWTNTSAPTSAYVKIGYASAVASSSDGTRLVYPMLALRGYPRTSSTDSGAHWDKVL